MLRRACPLAHGIVLAVALAGGNGQGMAQFQASNCSLYNWLDLTELGGADNGSDVWHYVSPSGREYALMGVSNKLVVVEVTNPASPVVVGNAPHSNSLWADVETFQQYAYVSNESGGGIDVVNLGQVDNGIVTEATPLTLGGLATTHTLSVDTVSGFLYLNGSNLNGGRLRAYSLANPASPTFAGVVSDADSAYTHDSLVVTYASGPYAGKQIAFCCNGGTGLDIYDVTSKSNMFRMSRTVYPNLAYCHQGWLSVDRQYFYVNDELDGTNETVIFDVSNLAAPVLVGTSTSGVSATDHNVYVRDGYLYEAEYRAGLRVFCLDDPVNPIQVGWFDSYPENDASGYDGAWSVNPFLPSGTVLIADINRGLFIVDASEALKSGSVTFGYPAPRPETINPQGGTSFQVAIAGSCGASLAPASPTLHYNLGQGFQTVPLDDVGGGLYEAVFPAAECGSLVPYYLGAQDAGGATFVDPPGAPSMTYDALAVSGSKVLFTDNFETNQGWVATNLGASSGLWQRGVPVNDPGWSYDPATDGDGSGQAWLTQNELGNTDVDNGAVRLTSPVLDLSAGDVTISYEYFLRLTEPGPGTDHLLLEISPNGDAGPWTVIADHTADGGLAWHHHEVTQAQLDALGVPLTANMKVRFTSNDAEPASINESGLDGFTVGQVVCDEPVVGDVNGDGLVNVADLVEVVLSWGPCPGCPADVDGDGTVGVNDMVTVILSWS
jgi:choice-of-anchor B domain-containing protein